MTTQAHEFSLRVYYEDTDAGGRVYYANYLKFAERARTELLRTLGIEQSALLAQAGLGFVVRRCEADFRAGAALDDLLIVRTTLRKVQRASLTMAQSIRRDETVMADLLVRLACIDSAGRPCALPSALRDTLSANPE